MWAFSWALLQTDGQRRRGRIFGVTILRHLPHLPLPPTCVTDGDRAGDGDSDRGEAIHLPTRHLRLVAFFCWPGRALVEGTPSPSLPPPTCLTAFAFSHITEWASCWAFRPDGELTSTCNATRTSHTHAWWVTGASCTPLHGDGWARVLPRCLHT